MKKLIIINDEPLTLNTKRLWMIDDLLDRGVQVEYWDISQLLSKKIVYPNRLEDDSLIVINTLRELKEKIKKENKGTTLFVDEFLYTWRNVWLRIYLKLSFCRLARINVYYVFLNKEQKSNNKLNFINKVHKIPAWTLMKFTNLFKLQSYNVVFSPYDTGSTNTIRINLPDYENYLNNKSNIKDDNTIVFIDEFFPLHPDFKVLNNYICSNADVEHYREKMIRVFESLEKRYNKTVIIAAHPKSNYKGGEFGARRIVYGQTCSLILSSSIVVSHTSVADLYAILAEKQIVFLNSNQFQSVDQTGEYYRLVQEKASELGLQAFNIDDDDVDAIAPGLISRERRLSFLYSSVTSKETEGKYNADIISDYLLNA